MKNKLIHIFLFSLFLPRLISAQFINEGASVIVESGTTFIVKSDVINTSGTIHLETNSFLVVSGDFISENAASFTSDPNSNVKFVGIGNINIKSGGDAFENIIFNKNAGSTITLLDPATVKTNLEFTPANGNKLLLLSNDLTFENSAIISNADNTHYLQADGSGMVFKKFSSPGTFFYPVGDNDDYSPIKVEATNGIYNASSNIGVVVKDLIHPNLYDETDAYLSRYWPVEANNITNFEGTLTGSYVDSDIIGTEADIKGVNFNGVDWNFSNALNEVVNNKVIGDISSNGVDFTGMNFYGKMASIKTFLHGAYDGGILTTTLNSEGLLPLTSPYGTGESVAVIPSADITDWVKIELRDPTDATSILKTYSKFLKSNGQIVDLDGSSTPRFIDAPTSAFIAIRHRNHLGVRTSSSLDLITSPYQSHDFTTASSQAYGSDAMKEVESGVWAMWGGNANGDQYVRAKQIFIPGSGTIYSDRDYILNTVLLGDVNGQIDAYNEGDTNMDGHVRAKQIFIPGSGTIYSDRDFILNKVLIGNPNGQKDEQL